MQMLPAHIHFKIYRIREVCEITGLGRSTIYNMIKSGEFPKQLELSSRAVGWSSDSVFDWVASRKSVI
jgi:prophage regulatory protein